MNVDSATDDAQIAYQFQIVRDDLPFTMDGSEDIGFLFDLIREADGSWKVTAVKSKPASAHASGGDQDLIPQAVKQPAISPSDAVAAGGSVVLLGTLDLPDLQTDQIASAEYGLEWNNNIGNLVYHNDGNDSVFVYNLSKSKGELNLAAILPDQGAPQGIEIPSELTPGIDSVNVSMTVVVYQASPIGSPVPLALVSYNWNVPMESFTSGEKCHNAPLDDVNHNGIWRIYLADGPLSAYPLLLDMSIVKDKIVSASMEWYQDNVGQGKAPEFLSPPLTGTLTGNTIDLVYQLDCQGGPGPTVLDWTADINGLALQSGTFTLVICGGAPQSSDFTGEKISNRCAYIPGPEDITGDWTLTTLSKGTETWSLVIDPNLPNQNFYNITGRGIDYYGVIADNRMFAYEKADVTKLIYFVFNDSETGVLTFVDTGETGDVSRSDD